MHLLKLYFGVFTMQGQGTHFLTAFNTFFFIGNTVQLLTSFKLFQFSKEAGVGAIASATHSKPKQTPPAVCCGFSSLC